MKYEFAPDLQYEAETIIRSLFPHIKIGFVKCLRSYGSSSNNTIARCHALGKLMQKAMGVKAFYAIEFLSEHFDSLPQEEKTKVIIHELMHIPKSFGGGFKHHDFVTTKNVNILYKQYKLEKEKTERSDEINKDKTRSWF